MIKFQEGEFPIQQVIYCNLDSVLGALVTGTLLKEKYGSVDIIHNIRKSVGNDASDLDMLMATTLPVVSTCWSSGRLKKVLAAYVLRRGWDAGSVRIYSIGHRVV